MNFLFESYTAFSFPLLPNSPNPNATPAEEYIQPQTEDFNDSNTTPTSQLAIFDLTGNQEGEDDFTSSQEPEVADNVTSISLLDRAFLQTKPNSLETELEIENIFSLIAANVKPTKVNCGRKKKRITLKWPMTESLFHSIFPDSRNMQEERKKRKTKKKHTCGGTRKRRNISEITRRRTFRSGEQFADYFKKEPVIVYEADAVAFLIRKTNCSLVKHTVVQWKINLDINQMDIIEDSIIENSYNMFHLSFEFENTTRWNRMEPDGVQTEVEWKEEVFEKIKEVY